MPVFFFFFRCFDTHTREDDGYAKKGIKLCLYLFSETLDDFALLANDAADFLQRGKEKEKKQRD